MAEHRPGDFIRALALGNGVSPATVEFGRLQQLADEEISRALLGNGPPIHFYQTDEDIARDLAPLTIEQCAARGIRHSSSDDHSTAILDTDPDWLTRGMLGAAARKTLRTC